MVEFLRWLEALILVAAAVAVIRGRGTAAVTLYGTFLATYGAKLLLGEPVRYAGAGAWRGLYLGLLALHAAGVAVCVALLVGWWVSNRRARVEATVRWRRMFLGAWLVAALTGVLAFATFVATSARS